MIGNYSSANINEKHDWAAMMTTIKTISTTKNRLDNIVSIDDYTVL